MKKLLEKIYNLKWYQSLPIWYIFFTLFVFSLYKLILIGADLSVPENPLGSNLVLMKISLAIAIPFSLIFTLFQAQMKMNLAFWGRAKEVEKEIGDAETLKELNRIIEDEFSQETGKLRKMALGLPHYQKAKELYKIMEIKAKYVS